MNDDNIDFIEDEELSNSLYTIDDYEKLWKQIAAFICDEDRILHIRNISEAEVKKVWNGTLFNGFYSYQFVYKGNIYEFYPGTPHSEWCLA